MCPVTNEPMIALQLSGVEIDYCAACQGVWLDEGELELISGLAGVAPGVLTKALRETAGRPHDRRRCPRCRCRLQAIEAGAGDPIKLDRCPRGCGLWFDKDELRDFICRFDTGEAGAAASFFADLFGKDDGRWRSMVERKES